MSEYRTLGPVPSVADDECVDAALDRIEDGVFDVVGLDEAERGPCPEAGTW